MLVVKGHMLGKKSLSHKLHRQDRSATQILFHHVHPCSGRWKLQVPDVLRLQLEPYAGNLRVESDEDAPTRFKICTTCFVYYINC